MPDSTSRGVLELSNCNNITCHKQPESTFALSAIMVYSALQVRDRKYQQNVVIASH